MVSSRPVPWAGWFPQGGWPGSAPFLPAGQALEQTSYAVLLSQSVGQIAAEYLWAYPPGIPLIVPGEKIGPDFPALCAAYEASGVHLKHTSHTPADTILICKEAI